MVVRRRLLAGALEWKSAAAKRLMETAGNTENVDAAIAHLVATLLEGVGCLPTDLRALGAKLRVSSIVEEPIPALGEVRRAGNDYIVAYAAGMPVPRGRFTIAHECGHILLERCGARQARESREVERLC